MSDMKNGNNSIKYNTMQRQVRKRRKFSFNKFSSIHFQYQSIYLP